MRHLNKTALNGTTVNHVQINMGKFKKKPVVIEAVQWNGKNFDEVMNFIGEFYGNKFHYENEEERALKSKELFIKTLEGTMTASKGDWIIKGINGEFYPCKPDIFEKTYKLEKPDENINEEDILGLIFDLGVLISDSYVWSDEFRKRFEKITKYLEKNAK